MNEDQKLQETLRAWKVDAPPPSRFQSEVWARIRERDEAAGGGFLNWLLAPFSGGESWRLATTSALALAIAGIALGTIGATTVNERRRVELENRYVQSIDPYLRAANVAPR